MQMSSPLARSRQLETEAKQTKPSFVRDTFAPNVNDFLTTRLGVLELQAGGWSRTYTFEHYHYNLQS